MGALRTLVLLLVGGFLVLFLYMQRTEVAYDKPYGEIQVTSPNAFAVIELFSSQSCTDCIDAEVMISDIVQQVELLNMPVYVLNFHTNSLDSHMWEDTYGTTLFTDRFRAYVMGQRKQNDSLPQIIFNGHETLTTPNRLKTYRLIEESLQTHRNGRVDIWGEMTGKRFLSVYAKGEGLYQSDPLILHVALVEKGLQETITGGPLKGQTLLHDNIVHEFLSTPWPNEDQVRVDVFIKDHFKRHNLSAIAYIQNERTLEIVAANNLSMNDVPDDIVSNTYQRSRLQDPDEGFSSPSVRSFDNTPAGLQ